MQDGEIQNKTITITKVEEGENGKLTIQDQDKKRYSFFKKTKARVDEDGKDVPSRDSKPYVQFKNMELGVGSVARIGFVIEAFTIKQGENAGKEGKANKVISFTEPRDQDRAEVEQPSGEFVDREGAKVDAELDRINRNIVEEERRGHESLIWEAKDRLHAAQTAANFVAMIHEGSGKDPLTLKGEMNEVYAWLLAKKSGGETSGEDISVEDIPFA